MHYSLTPENERKVCLWGYNKRALKAHTTSRARKMWNESLCVAMLTQVLNNIMPLHTSCHVHLTSSKSRSSSMYIMIYECKYLSKSTTWISIKLLSGSLLGLLSHISTFRLSKLSTPNIIAEVGVGGAKASSVKSHEKIIYIGTSFMIFGLKLHHYRLLTATSHITCIALCVCVCMCDVSLGKLLNIYQNYYVSHSSAYMPSRKGILN